jgi:polyisoprenoid-binding protein YceI
MKNIMIVFAAFIALNATANEAKKATTPANAKLDVAASSAVWTGKKVTGSHTGKISFKDGSFEFKNSKFVKGEIVADLNSITNDDVKDAEYNAKLVGHLKGEDFFDVSKHPVATFKIESMNEIHNFVPGQPNMEVKGKVTIRGVTKPYATKVFFTENASGFDIKGKIVFDRTQFGLKYSSKKFFDVKQLGDKMIDDNFEVDLNLVAKK